MGAVQRHWFWSLWVWLELEDRRTFVAVHDPVESRPVRRDVQRVPLVPALLAQRLPQLVDRRGFNYAGERLTQDFFEAQREMIAHVLADLGDRELRLSQRQQDAIRLDRPRDVDGLAITVAQVDQGVPLSHSWLQSSLLLHPSREGLKSRARRGDDLFTSCPRAHQTIEPGEGRGSTSPRSPLRRRRRTMHHCLWPLRAVGAALGR